MNKALITLVLTLASGLALAQAASPDRDARRAQFRQHAEARFAQSDTNHDGRMSLAEFQDASDRRLADRFHRIDANNDGQLTREEMQAARSQRREHMGNVMHEHMEKMRALDTDHDQALTRAEIGTAMPKLLARFDLLDANHDGRITREEMRAGHDVMRAQHQAH